MKNKTPFFLIRSDVFCWVWLLNFAAKLPNYAAMFGIPQAWVDEIVAASALLDKVMKLLGGLRGGVSKVIKFKNALLNQHPKYPNDPIDMKKFLLELATDISSLPNILNRAISVANVILANPLCTDNIRADLRLVKPTDTEIAEATGHGRNPKVQDRPVLKATVAGDVIKITIVRGTPFRGLMAVVYVSRTDREEYEQLAFTNTGSVTDRAIFGEGVQIVTYTYRVQMMKGDEAVGQPSKPLIVVATRPLGQ